MLEIRKYRPEDFENARFVCLNSEGGGMGEELCEFILHIFCDYYLEKEPHNCFVLSDNGRAVGYIFCAEDFGSFKPVFESEYAPLVAHLGQGSINWAAQAYTLHEKFSAEYPAHLHIDILPEYQRGGWGGKLLKTLFEHLRSKGIKGVMLTTGTGNNTANNFYQKYGFDELGILDTDIAFGMKL